MAENGINNEPGELNLLLKVLKDAAKDPDQRMRIKDTAARPSDLSTGDIEKRSGASAPLRTTYGEIHLRMSDFRLRKT